MVGGFGGWGGGVGLWWWLVFRLGVWVLFGVWVVGVAFRKEGHTLFDHTHF